MQTIGLIGGMSWEFTAVYYATINRVVAERRGGLHSAELVLYSLDFQPVEELQADGRWEEAGRRLGAAAAALARAGADFLVLCTNTMHKVAPEIERAVSVPLLHIADATAAAVASSGIGTVGLLGSRFTMEQDFYRSRLESEHGLEVRVPDAEDRRLVDRVIYQELCRGRILEASRRQYRRVVEALAARGCGGVILGCTEIGLLLRPEDAPLPLFDTAKLHAEAAADLALGGGAPHEAG